ncbi:MAG: hypothetical protein AB1480_14870 [Nitrospirota bacterium]
MSQRDTKDDEKLTCHSPTENPEAVDFTGFPLRPVPAGSKQGDCGNDGKEGIFR